ncbi:acyl-CoA dehydrogenase [Pseudonocardia acidicola]|uniref:Acyl-CoA oxidase n=1 Tax=Pseudonocardia acidicola TaxID=2724939 RepID=A0ABX1SB72_9PSEU|nr:acyl-CoA dehydrogenase [Pseudonocardia acidicola]NMH98810.1 acyl-CoA oxidase [Pseudonocardia acidicola]
MTVERVNAIGPAALQRVLDGRWAAVRDDVRAQMGGIRLHPDPDLGTSEHRDLVADWMRRLAESRRPHTGFDPAYGGEGDVGGVVTAFQMLGYGDLSLLVKAGVQWGLFGGAVQVLGTSRHHDKYLKQIMDGDLPGCFAMTETGHGSDVQNLGTTATYDPATEEFEIHTPDAAARKDYIGNAARDGRMAVVFAQLITGGASHGVHALLVPIRSEEGSALPGVTISDCGRKAGLNGVDNGRLIFDRVRVPREALLNRYAEVAPDGTYTSPIENETRRFFTMLGTLVRGRISVAGGAGSATQKALAIAIRYGETRRQFSDPATGEEVVVLDYLAHQRKLLPALATTYALHFAQEELVSAMHAVQAFGAEPDEAAQRTLETKAAGIKAVGTWHATATIQACREACGGAGYLAENLLPQLKADTDVFTTFEGDNTVLLQLVAKGLLSEYGARVKKLGPLGMARFVGEQVAGSVVERTGAPAMIGQVRHRDLLDRGYHRALLVDREDHLLAALARRLRKALTPGADQFGIFNAAQDHLLRAARAHVDRIVFDAFAAAVERTGDAAVKRLLDQVCHLYALSVIESERAWFVEHGRFTAARSRAVTTAVNELCAALRPHARALVDGFGIPEDWLACPLLGTDMLVRG